MLGEGKRDCEEADTSYMVGQVPTVFLGACVLIHEYILILP